MKKYKYRRISRGINRSLMAYYNKIMLRQFNNNTISAQEKRAYNQWAHERNLEELRQMYSKLEMGDRSAKRWGYKKTLFRRLTGGFRVVLK